MDKRSLMKHTEETMNDDLVAFDFRWVETVVRKRTGEEIEVTLDDGVRFANWSDIIWKEGFEQPHVKASNGLVWCRPSI